MYTNIFDAHCHYDDEWYNEDRIETLESLPSKGVCGVVTNATDLENVKLVLQLTEKYPFVYGTVGIHPECLENLPTDYLDRVAEISQQEKIVAIGEIESFLAAYLLLCSVMPPAPASGSPPPTALPAAATPPAPHGPSRRRRSCP